MSNHFFASCLTSIILEGLIVIGFLSNLSDDGLSNLLLFFASMFLLCTTISCRVFDGKLTGWIWMINKAQGVRRRE